MNYFTNHCEVCGGGVEFPANGVGEKIECPHCHKQIRLEFPNDTNVSPDEQLNAFLAESVFPTTRDELIVLERFLGPRDPSTVEAEELITRFSTEGFLEAADPVSILQLKSSNDLKQLAKDKGVASSGTKEVLAKRLLKADPEGIARITSERRYLVCSDKSKMLVEKLREAQRFAKSAAENDCLQMLNERRLRDACFVVSKYEAKQPFSRGLGLDWKNYDCGHDLSILEGIFGPRLSRHANLADDELRLIQIAAGMLNLWGENNPSRWLSNRTDLRNEVMMLLFHASHQTRITEMKDAGIKWVTMLPPNDSDVCPVCRSQREKKYSIDAVPDIPCEGCTCETGCRCIALATK